MSYVTGNAIKELREKRHLTQKELAETILVSDKTISKWETGRGLPDIGIIEELSAALGVSVGELLTGEYRQNENRVANMKKTKFYVCPVCGNVIAAVGQGCYTCCGITLPAAEATEAEDLDDEHKIVVSDVDGELWVTMNHPMDKKHSISFIAYVTSDTVELVKLYPEQEISVRFRKKGYGVIYAFCNRHGLYKL